MSSDPRTPANRRNSRRSRGPTTSAGKAKSRANALRHGLASTVLAPGHLCDEVEVLAKGIAGDDADVSELVLARKVAAAQIDLVRVQAARVALMNSQFVVASATKEQAAKTAKTIRNADPNAPAAEPLDETSVTQDMVLIPSTDILNQLARFDRYERRAVARYRHAARAFMTAQAPHSSPKSRSPR